MSPGTVPVNGVSVSSLSSPPSSLSPASRSSVAVRNGETPVSGSSSGPGSGAQKSLGVDRLPAEDREPRRRGRRRPTPPAMSAAVDAHHPAGDLALERRRVGDERAVGRRQEVAVVGLVVGAQADLDAAGRVELLLGRGHDLLGRDLAVAVVVEVLVVGDRVVAAGAGGDRDAALRPPTRTAAASAAKRSGESHGVTLTQTRSAVRRRPRAAGCREHRTRRGVRSRPAGRSGRRSRPRPAPGPGRPTRRPGCPRP